MKFNKAVLAAALLAAPIYTLADVGTFHLLYNNFDSFGNSPAGGQPYGGLVGDGSASYYGTTFNGGANSEGTVFEIVPGQTPTPIVTFSSTVGLTAPATGLVFDSDGNMYGTANSGSYGAVFEVAAGTHALSTLVAFNSSNGSAPLGFLTTDSAGDIFGTTQAGGTSGQGTVFEISAGNHAMTTLANFNSSGNGLHPYGGVAVDSKGDIFGTTTDGGAYGDGAIYEIAALTNAFTLLASFNGSNGSQPQRSPILDAAGNLFGVTEDGGTSSGGFGTVFEVKAGSRTITTLVDFTSKTGEEPDASLIEDADGDLFGTTQFGGSSQFGTVFEVNGGTHSLTTLVNFTGPNGADPRSGLYNDGSGDLFGTTTSGGISSGVAFELTGSGFVVPEPTALSLLAFTGVGLLRRRRLC